MPTTTPHFEESAQQAQARLMAALEAVWRELAQQMSREVDLSGPGCLEGLLEAARVVGALQKQLKCLLVIALIGQGFGWVGVAERLGMAADVAYEVYGEAVLRWRLGDSEPWRPVRAAQG